MQIICEFVILLGFYMYAKSPGSAHGTARLFSKMIPKTGSDLKCLKFFYNMFGSTVGFLVVRLYLEREAKPRTLFVKSGNQGQKWKLFNVTLYSKGNFQVTNLHYSVVHDKYEQ